MHELGSNDPRILKNKVINQEIGKCAYILVPGDNNTPSWKWLLLVIDCIPGLLMMK
jgi:hypothetical protein